MEMEFYRTGRHEALMRQQKALASSPEALMRQPKALMSSHEA